MSEDLDVERLLEDTYQKKKNRIRSSRSSSYERKLKRPHSSKNHDSPIKGKSRRDSRSPSYNDRDRRKRDRKGRRWTNMVDRADLVPLNDQERDARTILIMQMGKDVIQRDIEEFFEDVGKIREIRMISDRNSRRSKGIAYVEFQHPESVALALRLSGKKLHSKPVIIQNTMCEKNRAALELTMQSRSSGPTKLYVGNLHSNITEKMLRAIFEPFGQMNDIQLQTDVYGRSRGYGHITYREPEFARQAIEKMDGFILANQKIKVCQITERMDSYSMPVFNTSILDDEETDKGGVGLNATSRSLLMKKLARSKGITDVPGFSEKNNPVSRPKPSSNPTNCILLSNMFDAVKHNAKTNISKEIENDLYKVVSDHAQILHIHVDLLSKEGDVYMKLRTVGDAMNVVEKINGKKYAGRIIKVFHVSNSSYHSLFPSVLK